jgi:hypothetical protein
VADLRHVVNKEVSEYQSLRSCSARDRRQEGMNPS